MRRNVACVSGVAWCRYRCQHDVGLRYFFLCLQLACCITIAEGLPACVVDPSLYMKPTCLGMPLLLLLLLQYKNIESIQTVYVRLGSSFVFDVRMFVCFGSSTTR